ncbi:hypothetical protein TGCAST_203890 [Toxoplasma gondii CAST]|uniref:Uncharacterized protein n=1 Tax=Toxoplasma gondii CAST TaxID=943122 RepID=A0A3R7ZAH1_TOXGO|nr:hypothetical protein TGCAST_203890 [Toxoplasma gondii CAST]
MESVAKMILPKQLLCVAIATMMLSLSLSVGRRGPYGVEAVRSFRTAEQDYTDYDTNDTLGTAEETILSSDPKYDSAESAKKDAHENMSSFVEQAGGGKHVAKDSDSLITAAARIAQLNPEETLGRWHAEQARGTQVEDFLDNLLGTKNVKVSEEEQERIKPFAEQEHLDLEQTLALWKKFKKDNHSVESFIGHVKSPHLRPDKKHAAGGAHKKISDGKESSTESKSWGEAIGDAVDYAGDKVAEGWNALAARFTSPESHQAASEAASQAAAERGDVDAVSETAHLNTTKPGKQAKADGTMKLSCNCTTVQAKPHH